MPPNAPKVGDSVIHHGHRHEILSISEAAVMKDGSPTTTQVVRFRNAPYTVAAHLPELKWSSADSAWYLPGRILARNERALAQALTGTWPAAENHLAVRSMIDSVDLDDVDRDRLANVLRQRKPDALALAIAAAMEAEGLSGEDAARKIAKEGPPEGAAADAFHQALLAYAEKAINQAAALREARNG